MVKKLYKYEFLALLRTLLPVYVALFGVALLSRFLQIFENKSVAYAIVFGSSCFAYTYTLCSKNIPKPFFRRRIFDLYPAG